MAISCVYAAHLFAVLTNLLCARGFNLETRLPMVKLGHSNSYFGYSVAAHQIRHNLSGPSNAEGLILVGAPLDQNLQPNTSRSGALWRCPLTSNTDDCSQVVTDGRKEVDGVDLFGPTPTENKTNQWLGVTVRSQGPGGKVLVCAHRYKIVEKVPSTCSASNLSEACTSPEDYKIWGMGLCYILEQNLDFLKAALCPCKGKPVKKEHEEYGYCQAGTSGLIFEDDNALIGAPGPLRWAGAVYVSNFPDDGLSRDNRVYQGLGVEFDDGLRKRVNKDGYMGMAVTAGYFLGDNVTVFVAGAPRNNETGQVMLFTKDLNRHGGANNDLKERMLISGEQIASNFGYEVIAADLNGDGLPDLIVAAPFYFANGVGGAVYVFMNHPQRHLDSTWTTKLTGKPESRFGFAMARLGDLNKDGYEDIAIGAPYENSGAVYIYLGSREGLITVPSQVIRAEMVKTDIPISTLGYSLSGGIDLDDNGYPDLVIGAYEKDAVILLRARPIIGLTTSVHSPTNLTNFDPNARNCQINNNYIPCFQFETCCVIDSVVKTRQRELLIQYKLHAETFDNRRTTSRIWFDDINTKNETVFKNITISGSDSSNLKFCQKHIAYLKENTLDIQSPIQMRMSYTLVHKEPEKTVGPDLPRLDNYPILNLQEADKIFNATFLKDCGLNDICECELVMTTGLSLKRRNSAGNDAHQYELVLGEQEKVYLNVSVTNKQESAYETQLFVQMPKQVDYGKLSAVMTGKKQYDCRAQNSIVSCRLGNPLKSGEVVALQLEFDLQKVNNSEPTLEFKVFVNTTSEDRNRINNDLSLTVHVVENTNLAIDGTSLPEEIPEFVNTQLKGESAIKYKDEIGYKVTHTYNIVNKGPWRVSNVEVHIEWPYEVVNDKPQGKRLLYLDENPLVEGSEAIGRCDIPAEYINPLNYADRRPELLISNNSLSSAFLPGDKNSELKKGSTSSAWANRVRRDTEKIVTAETYTNADGVKSKRVLLNCVIGPTAKCYRFVCYLDSIEKGGVFKIIFRSRLWDATLIEDYANIDQIDISSRAKMHFPKSNVDQRILSPNEVKVTTRARVTLHGQQMPAPIPLFIIIAAIIIGLLLFILLTLLLWKLGFFKRRRPDPTLSGNLEKHRIDESYHDY